MFVSACLAGLWPGALLLEAEGNWRMARDGQAQRAVWAAGFQAASRHEIVQAKPTELFKELLRFKVSGFSGRKLDDEF